MAIWFANSQLIGWGFLLLGMLVGALREYLISHPHRPTHVSQGI